MATFDSQINYANLIWGQKPRVELSSTMNFQSRDSHASPLFRSNHIVKLEDDILIENILFISKSFNNLLPSIFKGWFTFCSDVHNYHTVPSTADTIFTVKVTFSFLKYVLACKNSATFIHSLKLGSHAHF